MSPRSVAGVLHAGKEMPSDAREEWKDVEDGCTACRKGACDTRGGMCFEDDGGDKSVSTSRSNNEEVTDKNGRVEEERGG